MTSSSRATYAQGSLRAARYLATQKAGLLDTPNVLNPEPGLKTAKEPARRHHARRRDQ
jgi:hypothetical protein